VLDARSWFHERFARERIPALMEVLEWVQDLDKEIMEEQCLVLFASNSYAIIQRNTNVPKGWRFDLSINGNLFFTLEGSKFYFNRGTLLQGSNKNK
jgi:hypothetical protein